MNITLIVDIIRAWSIFAYQIVRSNSLTITTTNVTKTKSPLLHHHLQKGNSHNHQCRVPCSPRAKYMELCSAEEMMAIIRANVGSFNIAFQIKLCIKALPQQPIHNIIQQQDLRWIFVCATS